MTALSSDIEISKYVPKLIAVNICYEDPYYEDRRDTILTAVYVCLFIGFRHFRPLHY